MNLKNPYKKRIRDIDREIKNVEKEIRELTSYDRSAKRLHVSNIKEPVVRDTDDKTKLANYLGAGSIQTLGMHKYHKQDIKTKSVYIIIGVFFILLLIWLIFK